MVAHPDNGKVAKCQKLEEVDEFVYHARIFTKAGEMDGEISTLVNAMYL